MPKHPKVVSITTGREKLAQRWPNVINLPLRPGDLVSRIECRRSATGMDLLVRSLLTPILSPPTRAARKPVRPIPIRARTNARHQDGGNPTQLTSFETGPSGTPRWSPDGRWIAFDRQLSEGYRIFVMASDGGQVRRLTPEEGESDEYIPSWSRHGNWIYYGCNRTGRDEVWKAPAQGGQGTQVTHNGGFVAFESSDGQSLYYTKTDENSGIWVQPRAGGQERLIVDSIISRSFAVVDEGIYYFVPSKPDGSTSLRLHSFATGKNVEIAPMNREIVNGMTVSPDRKTTLFSTVVRSGSNLMVVDNFR